MRMLIGIFTGYNISGAKAPGVAARHVKTWKGKPGFQERNYWVDDGEFYLVDKEKPLDCFEGPNPIDLHALPDRKSESVLPRVLSKAVMQVVMQWKADE